MKAVCDTSPLCFLVMISEIEIMPELFDEVFVPEAVSAELGHPKAPDVVREWISKPPEWLKIRSVEPIDDPRLRWLHPGEREAIFLVQELAADWLIVDELAGRRLAQSLGLRVTGLLGLLLKAARRDLLDLPEAIGRLRATHFRVEERLLKQLLQEHGRAPRTD